MKTEIDEIEAARQDLEHHLNLMHLHKEHDRLSILKVSTIQQIRKALTAAKAMQWQPIETAPRDGTKILVFGENKLDGKYQSIAYFDKEYEMFMKGYKTTVGHAYLTHWMPLPEQPSKGEY